MKQIITKETHLKRNQKDFVTAELDGELVLMHLETADYFGMDKTTTQMWKLLDQPKTIERLVKDLTSLYEVAPEQCEQDIRPVLEDMVGQDFLQLI